MKRVIIESPFKDDDLRKQEYNRAYVFACMEDAIKNYNESPYASHALYTLFLDDRIPAERNLGIETGFVWREVAEKSVVYTNLGISPGMIWGIDDSNEKNKPVEYRALSPEQFIAFHEKNKHLLIAEKAVTKVLIVAASEADCYPSLDVGTITNAEEFGFFMNQIKDVKPGITWEDLDFSQAAYIQDILNTSQESQEYSLTVVEL